MDILNGNFRLLFENLYGRHANIVHKCDTSVTHMLMSLFRVYREGCRMWGRKCSLFPEHLISLPWGVDDFTH